MSKHTVVLHILDKEYQVTCTPDQEAGLKAAATKLDQQMRDIRKTGKVVGTERIAVMVALNNTYDLLNGAAPSETQDTGPSKNHLDALKRVNNKVEEALHRLRQLEIN